MLSCSLVITTDGFSPLHAAPELVASMGYPSHDEFTAGFATHLHFKNTSALRLFTNADPEAVLDITLLNLDGKPVGTVHSVTLNHDRRSMSLKISLQQQAAPKTAQRRTTLDLDASWQVMDIQDAHGIFADIRGQRFPDAIAPPGWAKRIGSALQWLTGRGSTRSIVAPACDQAGLLVPASWVIAGRPGGSFRVDLYTPADMPDSTGALTLELLMRSQTTRLVYSRNLLDRIPLQAAQTPPGIDALLQIILPEDRQWVRKVLCHPALPDTHALTYRIAGPDGIVLPVKHALQTIYQKPAARRIHSTLKPVHEADLDWVEVSTIGLCFDLATVDSDQVLLRNFLSLQPFFERIRQLHADAVANPDLTASISRVGRCTFCKSTPAADQALQLKLGGMLMSRQQLHRLVSSEHSPLTVGDSSGWRALFLELHHRGYHMNIGLDGNDQVTINLFS